MGFHQVQIIGSMCSEVEKELEKTPLVYFYWDVKELLNTKLSLR